jgi:hypothetical protein
MVPTLAAPGGTGSSTAANKVVAIGSELELMRDAPGVSLEQTLLSVTGKFSDPKDLLIQLTAETALLTKVKGGGATKDTSIAKAAIVAWVEIDGNVVPVCGATGGEVTLDLRAFGIETLFDEAIEYVEIFIKTKSAHGFNWVAMNVGDYDESYNGMGTYDIEVIGLLKVAEHGVADAAALVGARTLVVEPIKVAQGTTVM